MILHDGKLQDRVTYLSGRLIFAFANHLFNLLAILLVAVVQPGPGKALTPQVSLITLFVALGLVYWPGLARLVRGQAMALRNREFVEAARAMGARDWQIMLRHVLPNALPAIIVSASLTMGGAILAESSLSFLGIGIQPPNASWGNTLSDNYTFWRTQTWMVLAPGAVIATVIAAFSFLGDGLNEALNPKSGN